jgi:AbiV family abortive infection protein
MTFEELQAIRSACLKNADRLVTSAQHLLNIGIYHTAYHLAALALEEIGKSGLMVLKYRYDKHKTGDESYDPDTEDHVKKLFWALWGMSILFGKPTPEEMKSSRGLAKLIHENRLKYLYVDTKNPLLPQDQATRTEAASLVGAANVRLDVENSLDLPQSDSPMEENIKWFIIATENPEQRSLLFSQYSYDRLVKLGDTDKWIAWLREEDQRLQQETQDAFEKEMAREIPMLVGFGEPKWKVKLRLRSDSHSIRNVFFTRWNAFPNLIRLDKSKDKREMVCQFSLPSSIPMQDVFDKGWIFSKLFVVALNIGSGGFFWWHVPRDLDKYFDEITDVETGLKIKAGGHSRLKVDWGRQVLTEVHVLPVFQVMHYWVRIRNTPEADALDAYFTGLALIGKTDIHLQFEANAFERFHHALKLAMYMSGDWNRQEGLQAAIERYLAERQLMVPSEDLEQLSRHLRLAAQLEATRTGISEITLEDAISMKRYCDVYFKLRAFELFQELLRKQAESPKG